MKKKTLAFKISKPFKEIKKSVSEKILGTKKGHVHQSKQSTETKLINLIEEREELENKLKDIENQLNKIQNTPMNKVKKTFNEIFNKK